MAISWAPFQNRARLGVEPSYSPAVGQGTTQVTVRMKLYMQMDEYASTDMTTTWSYSGDFGSGSVPQHIAAGPGQIVLINEWAKVVNLTDSAQSLSLSASVPHFHGTSTISDARANIPARYARTPTSLTVTRNSDTSHRLNWTRNSTYSAVVVQRRENAGSGWSAWSQVGRPTGNASTYTDTTTKANRQYQWRVAGVGGSGQSGWSGTVTAYTTPAKVGTVTASKVGTDIQVTATGLPPYATSYRIADNGTIIDSNVTSWPWTHSSPNASVTHKYTVYAVRGSLASAGTDSNTVQLLAPPLAPTSLSPNGGVVASDEPIHFSWLHNPVDTSAQSGFELRYREVGVTQWLGWLYTDNPNSYLNVIDLPVTSYEWKVRTKGAHGAFGPESAVATVTVITRPGVAVQGDPIWDRPVYTVTWDFEQAEGRPQSAWEVELFDSQNVRLERRTGSGATTSVVLNTRFVDGETYTVQVRGATGDVWSPWSPLEVLAEFVPPAVPLAEGGWNDQAGTVELTVTEGGGDVVADLVTIERSVNLGDTWETLVTAAELGPSASFTDHESLSNGVTLYRVTATYSTTGSAAATTFEVVADSQHVWLSGGDGYTIHARLPFSPKNSVDPGRARTVEHYDGRELPVAYAGAHISNAYQCSGLIAATEYELSAVWQEMTVLAQHPSPVHMVRDPEGVRMYGSLSNIPMPRENTLGWRSYSFTLTETDH